MFVRICMRKAKIYEVYMLCYVAINTAKRFRSMNPVSIHISYMSDVTIFWYHIHRTTWLCNVVTKFWNFLSFQLLRNGRGFYIPF